MIFKRENVKKLNIKTKHFNYSVELIFLILVTGDLVCSNT